jgi:hypothetical protein
MVEPGSGQALCVAHTHTHTLYTVKAWSVVLPVARPACQNIVIARAGAAPAIAIADCRLQSGRGLHHAGLLAARSWALALASGGQARPGSRQQVIGEAAPAPALLPDRHAACACGLDAAKTTVARVAGLLSITSLMLDGQHGLWLSNPR